VLPMMTVAGVQERVDNKRRTRLNHCVLQPCLHALTQDLHHAVCHQSSTV